MALVVAGETCLFRRLAVPPELYGPIVALRESERRAAMARAVEETPGLVENLKRDPLFRPDWIVFPAPPV